MVHGQCSGTVHGPETQAQQSENAIILYNKYKSNDVKSSKATKV